MAEKKIVTIYAHVGKDSNWETGEKIGLSEEAIKNHFKYCCSEVELEIEVDMETGESEILAVDRRKLPPKKSRSLTL